MQKKLSKILAITLAMVMIFSLSACGGSKTDEGKASDSSTAAQTSTAGEQKQQEPVTLQFYLPPSEPNDMQAVLDEFYNRTKDTLNTKIVMNWVPFDDLQNKVAVKLSAGEQIDSTFNAPWQTMNQMIAKEQYLQLDKYFFSDSYPGLKKAFSQEFVDNNKFTDAKGESHIYGIPLTRYFGGSGGIYIRQDLMEKYGFKEINSSQDLLAFWDKILANEKGMIPFGFEGSLEPLTLKIKNVQYPMFDSSSVSEYNQSICDLSYVITNDNKVVVSGKDIIHDKEFTDALPDVIKKDPMYWYQEARNWYTKGIVEKDIISQKNAFAMFKAGKLASVCASGANDQTVYDSVTSQVQTAIPGAKVNFYPLFEAFRTATPKMVATDFKCWNFQCIPVTTKYADRVMQFYNWMFSDVKNHDLFEYGIEGKNFIAVGDDKMKFPEGLDTAKNYNIVGYQLSWNPTMIRYTDTLPDNIKKLNDLSGDPNFWAKRKDAGFNFNAEPVKAELAKCREINTHLRAVQLGMVDDIEGTLKKVQKELDDAGYQKIREEVKKQLEEYLAKKK